MYRQLHMWLLRGVWRLRDVSRLRRIRGGALRRVFNVQAWFLIESWKRGHGRLALKIRYVLKWHWEDENVAVLQRGRLLGTAGARTPKAYTALVGRSGFRPRVPSSNGASTCSETSSWNRERHSHPHRAPPVGRMLALRITLPDAPERLLAHDQVAKSRMVSAG
ncbi:MULTISPECIES: hypothetical protein [Myxococcus]|nr:MULTISPECIES: hypothetical protein [Myxococcus]NOJ55512.1 hypothetical protein [Myxococcus xanthus]QPM77899.1 hypothetical protein I5Q59_26930 [Myxococcus xanthus]QVW66966.1 hypothetical protein JTM82_32280 [Myxococcus xanthus DZ2]UEO06906.1 hypothetical protein K1515_10515 [Myxococcus xanthus DZ2]UYI12787.1 hypothetical protein N3T43_27525 [Myxococcus xanthus]